MLRVRLLALTLAALSAGCGASARLHVLRPAMLNARQFGGTMSVEQFTGDPAAAAVTTQELQMRVSTAEGAPVTLVPTQGDLMVHGSIVDFTYVENMHVEHDTCTRTVEDSEGNSYEERYSCTHYTRIGEAFASIMFYVTVTATGETIVATAMEDSSGARRSATDATPSHINGGAMLERLRSAIVDRFARVILPWREEVRVRFGRCGAARPACDEGIRAVRGGTFPVAISFFQQAISSLEAEEDPNPRHLAQAHWNLALAYEYSGSFQEAVDEIMRAAQLDPTNADYAPELQNVQQMADDAAQLREQGVETAPPPPPAAPPAGEPASPPPSAGEPASPPPPAAG